METINLIPKEERVQQTKTKVVKFSTILSIIILVIVGGVGGFFYYRAYTVRQELKQKEDNIADLRAQINQLVDIEINARNLFKKTNTLREIFDSRLYYSNMLEELEKSIPEGISVISFGINKDNQVSISGEAQTYNDVQDFSNRLLESPLFTEVSLNSVGLENTEDKINFFILVSYNEEELHE